jgi:hypothetical protein
MCVRHGKRDVRSGSGEQDCTQALPHMSSMRPADCFCFCCCCHPCRSSSFTPQPPPPDSSDDGSDSDDDSSTDSGDSSTDSGDASDDSSSSGNTATASDQTAAAAAAKESLEHYAEARREILATQTSLLTAGEGCRGFVRGSGCGLTSQLGSYPTGNPDIGSRGPQRGAGHPDIHADCRFDI